MQLSHPHELLVTTAYKKNEGKLFGGQFLDGISNAIDAVSMTRLGMLSITCVSYVNRAIGHA